MPPRVTIGFLVFAMNPFPVIIIGSPSTYEALRLVIAAEFAGTAYLKLQALAV